ncbi:MAG: hypothetical protein PVG93_06050 [Phycisphaerales bacterium]|jgi:hypothetical protein
MLLLLLVMAIAIGESISEGLPNPLKQPPEVQAEFAGMFAILIGMIVGLKWPRLAAAMILAGMAIFHVIESKLWINWVFGLFDLTGLLYLVSGDIAMKGKQKLSARIITLLAIALIIVFASAAAYAAKRFTPTNKLGLQFVNESPSAKYMVIVTHGWVEKGKGKWPQDMANAISRRVDVNDWLCGYFDWSKGAATIDPTDAAQYAKDISGATIAGQILALPNKFEHIHLIGHSSGCWAISEAAKILVNQTDADIHLTFFDAFIPSDWSQESLGNINAPNDVNFWADHYFTRDYTLKWTEQKLDHAHNIDVTEVDQLIKDHNFPWKWYYATITGTFPKWSLIDDSKLVTDANGIEYGFARSLESGDVNNWSKSLLLEMGNDAVKLKNHDKSSIENK